MKIVSSFLPAQAPDVVDNRPTIVAAFDTLVDQKSVVVGLTVGAVQGPNLWDVQVSEVGWVVMERAGAHHRRNYPDGPVVIAGVASVTGAKQRVR